MAAGGNKSKSTTQGTSSSESFVNPGQVPYLQDLYGQAQGMVNPGATQGAAQAASMSNNPALAAGLNGLTSLMNPQGQIDAQAASLQAGLGQMFREEINPAIESNAIAAGGFGGGRHGVAQGVATGQLGQAFTQGYGDIVARANSTALGAASQIPGMANANYANMVQPTMAGFDPLTQYAALIGQPTVLQQARAQQSGTTKSSGFSFGLG